MEIVSLSAITFITMKDLLFFFCSGDTYSFVTFGSFLFLVNRKVQTKIILLCFHSAIQDMTKICQRSTLPSPVSCPTTRKVRYIYI